MAYFAMIAATAEGGSSAILKGRLRSVIGRWEGRGEGGAGGEDAVSNLNELCLSMSSYASSSGRMTESGYSVNQVIPTTGHQSLE